MVTETGAIEALDHGLQQENQARADYEYMAARVDDAELQSMFMKIAKDEIRHAKMVRGLMGDLLGEPFTEHEYKPTDPGHSAATPEEIKQFLKEHILFERNIEKEYSDFLIRGHVKDDVRSVVDVLSNESEVHAQMLEGALSGLS